MDNVTVTSKIFEKKDGDYRTNSPDNFVAEGELTVTITLNEYRALVGGIATKKLDIEKANSDKYEREAKVRTLTEENNTLKAELYELKKKTEQTTEEKTA